MSYFWEGNHRLHHTHHMSQT